MRWMVLVLGLFLSGCYAHYQGRYYQNDGPPPLMSTSMDQVNAMVGVQQPSAYKVGFMEGCNSGRLSAGNKSFLFKKDADRFETDDVYKQGWNDGFNRCVSGEGAPAPRTTYYQSSYGYYAPSTVYTGFYYPSQYYSPGFSIWTGFPRHRYVHRHNHYYTPWYGNRHRGHRHGKPWVAKRGGGYKYWGGRDWPKSGGGGKSPGGRGGGGRKGGGGGGRGPYIR